MNEEEVYLEEWGSNPGVGVCRDDVAEEEDAGGQAAAGRGYEGHEITESKVFTISKGKGKSLFYMSDIEFERKER